jgi:uncharacterized membrane protein YkoI
MKTLRSTSMSASPSYRVVTAFLLSLLLTGPGQAGDGQDHDRARQALEAGEVLPLRTILERVERDHPGQIMEVELERKETGWIYEVKLLKTGGALVKLKIDARNGIVLDSKEKHDGNRRQDGGR